MKRYALLAAVVTLAVIAVFHARLIANHTQHIGIVVSHIVLAERESIRLNYPDV